MRVHILTLLAVALSVGEILGCGLSMKTPINHYDSVNERGFLSYWEQVGSFDFGSGLYIPLIVNFRSNRDALSPYGGYGWLVPLLESNVVQLEENRFMLVQPDGWNRYFGRKNASATALLGDGGWAAELKGNIFTAWANCGWKLVYINGKISSMVSPQNRRFDWVRNGDRVTEVREGGVAKLAVKWNDAGTEMTAIEADGKKFAFERNDKPRVQSVAGQNVVAAIDQSLSRIFLPDGTAKSYEFGVDRKMSPTFKIGTRLLTWNPVTKLILSDGDWKYQITPDLDGAYAAIGRKNSAGKSEYWHNDRNKGVEIVQGLDGIKKITTIFPTGKLAGRIRKVEEVDLSKNSKVTYQTSFDDKGVLTREYKNGKWFHLQYDDQKRLVKKIDDDGNILRENRFDDQGRLRYSVAGDLKETLVYRSDKEWQSIQALIPDAGKFQKNIEQATKVAIKPAAYGSFYSYRDDQNRTTLMISPRGKVYVY